MRGQGLFFIILFILFLLVDLYAFQGFKLLSKKWLPNYRSLLNILYWAIPIALWLSVFVVYLVDSAPEKNNIFKWSFVFLIGFFMSKVLWAVFLLVDDLIRGVRYVATPEPSAVGISRLDFIVASGAALGGLFFSGLIYGIFKGAHNYQVINRKLKLKNLPKVFEGLKIVQISDVHSGSFWSKTEVEKGIQLILDQKPDLIFFTGDLVNNRSDEFDNFKDIFGRLKAPHGVFSVLGNHDYGDYYSWPDVNGMTKEQNLEDLKTHYKDMNWKLLMNENHLLEIEGEKLAVIGVENWSGHGRFPKYGDLAKAHRGTENIENKLLLSHDPSHWQTEILKKYPDIDATFSGHTHGMQFGIDSKYLRWSPVKYMYKEFADLYQENEQYLYVNRGFGYLGYPGRLGFYPEITLFELESC